MGTECQSQFTKTLNLLGSKWVLLILRNLCTEKRGFNQLLRMVEGISPRLLSARLKEMAEAGLIKKTVFPTTPPQVEYELTEKGLSLKSVIEQLAAWAQGN